VNSIGVRGAFLPFAAIALAALQAMPAQAKEGDTFGAYASYAHYYDSNLFRLAEDENAVIIENGFPRIPRSARTRTVC